jgi:CubicO group peptidase (beta-lactamase class C family)
MCIAKRIAFLAVAVLPSLAHAESATTLERISRVENGLLPTIVFKGEIAKPFTFANRMKHHNVPGMSIAVMNDGAIAWERGFGVTEVGATKAITPMILFQAGAVSKPVAALAVMRMVELGKLDLDEDVNTRLVGWKVPQNRFTVTEKVTLRRLLSHTAGVTIDSFPGYSDEKVLPSLLQVLSGREPARNALVTVDLIPGSKYRESGGGYVIVQQLLTDVTHQPFARVMQESVLSELQMTHSTYEQPLPKDQVAGAASGHRPDGTIITGKWRIHPEQAAAGLWTTPSDLACMVIEVRSAVAGNGHKFLSSPLARQMLTPQLQDSGLGFFVNGKGDVEHFSHGGRNDGFDTVLTMYTRSGKGAVIMINANNNGGFVSEVLQSIAKEYEWPDFTPTRQREVVRVDGAILRSYEGRYRLERDNLISIQAEDDRLFAKFPGIGRVELYAESQTRFFITVADLHLDFVKGAGNDITSLTVRMSQQVQSATRLP